MMERLLMGGATELKVYMDAGAVMAKAKIVLGKKSE